jgi:hypothetical protein
MLKMVALTCLSLLAAIASTSTCHARDSLYAERVTYPSGSVDMDVSISVVEGKVQSAVRAMGVVYVSLIETADHAEIINHVGQIAVRIPKHAIESEPTWKSTNRHQFALGGYCQVIVSTSTLVPQELCVVPASKIILAPDIAETTLLLGSFLAAINSSISADDLYANTLIALQRPTASGLPLIVRNPDRGAQREMRFKLAQREHSSDAIHKARKPRRCPPPPVQTHCTS